MLNEDKAEVNYDFDEDIGDVDDLEKHLSENYTNTKSHVSYLSPQKIYLYYRKRLPMRKIKKILEKQEGYTLLKPEGKLKVHTPTLSFYPGDLIQGDLFFVNKLAEYNDNTNYILSCICVHSKYAYLEPMITKTAEETRSKLAMIFERMPQKPNIIGFDQGTEFKNKEVLSFLKRSKIEVFFAWGENKCAVVEKFQKTIQRSIYSFLVQNETFRFIDDLQDLVNNYNNTIHTTISPLTPTQALDIKNVDILEAAHSRVKSKLRIRKIKAKYKPNQKVRITLKKNKYSRSYDIANTYEEYFIEKVLNDRITPFYILKDWKGRILKGKFSQNQLQPVDIQMHRGHVIAERVRKGKKEYLMKFKGYEDEYNEWVKEDDTENIT